MRKMKRRQKKASTFDGTVVERRAVNEKPEELKLITVDGAPYKPLWTCYFPERSIKTRACLSLFINNIVDVKIAAHCTNRGMVEDIARNAQTPIALDSLSEALDSRILVNGWRCRGTPSNLFDAIAAKHDYMRWWMSADGLTMAVVPPEETFRVPPFDALAGRLSADHWENGGLSDTDLLAISKELDKAGFSPKSEIERARWKPIVEYNQKYSKKAVRTFEEAARGDFAYPVRRRLYRAREKYLKAYTQVQEVLYL
jgi:hypothetical protein